MKLKNKKTRRVVDFGSHKWRVMSPIQVGDSRYEELGAYDTLAELNEEWEDYEEEPKEYWNITSMGSIQSTEDMDDEVDKERKEIGNHFPTKEEAERAVEKLKAWKRLKDKGFVWQGWEEGSLDNGMCIIGCQIPEDNWETDVVEDLDLLFGEEG